jgi:mannose-6-phosphate isomerase-like protein (cupin superfamily)
MPVIPLFKCQEFLAGDGCRLREILHPDKQDLDLRYSLAHATVSPKQTTTPHRLKTSEVYYILAGQGRMYINGIATAVQAHDTVYIPPEAVQSISNTSDIDLVFICIVDPAWRQEDETVLAPGIT